MTTLPLIFGVLQVVLFNFCTTLYPSRTLIFRPEAPIFDGGGFKKIVILFAQKWSKSLKNINHNIDSSGRCGRLQFYTIFANFRRKNGVFLKKTKLCLTTGSLSNKRRNFRQIFRRKYLENHDIGPRSRTWPVKTSTSSRCSSTCWRHAAPRRTTSLQSFRFTSPGEILILINFRTVKLSITVSKILISKKFEH
jgi:hypothetical protein